MLSQYFFVNLSRDTNASEPTPSVCEFESVRHAAYPLDEDHTIHTCSSQGCCFCLPPYNPHAARRYKNEICNQTGIVFASAKTVQKVKLPADAVAKFMA